MKKYRYTFNLVDSQVFTIDTDAEIDLAVEWYTLKSEKSDVWILHMRHVVSIRREELQA